MLAKSAMFLFASTFKLLIIIVADYCLYWVLDLIRIHGRLQTKVQAPNMAEVTVQGEGVLADLYRSVVKGLKPLGVEMEIDTITCLPEPIPPDYTRYVQIISTIFLCWILAMLEPYGLRLRYVVMCYYYPARTQQRAVWLYNHILRSRGSYIKFARRQLRRRFGKSKEGSIEKISIMDRLRALCPFLNIILGKSKKEMCVLCGKVFQVGNQEQLIRCSTPNCPGLYCLNCYADINDLCTICKKPVEYGDLSDESLEK
ncbi:DC-STAMP domain-containing protein 2 [Blattella germanica]|nr:DC-STAMP domain-containing protein 2 [Blattella germanica]